MPRGVNNWNFAEIIKFLKKNGFELDRVRGSHHIYTKKTKAGRLRVTIPFHGRKKSIHPRTFKSIVSQSGMSLEEWLA